MKHYIELTDSELEEFMNWKNKRRENATERIRKHSTLYKAEQAPKEPQKAEKTVGEPSKCSFYEVKLVPEKEVSFNVDFDKSKPVAKAEIKDGKIVIKMLPRTPLLKNLDLFEMFFNEGKRNYFLMHCLDEILTIGKIKIIVNAKMKMDDTTTRLVKSIIIENTGIKDGKINLTVSLNAKRVIFTYYETKHIKELQQWLTDLTDVDKFLSTIKFNFIKGFVEKPATILAKKYVNRLFGKNAVEIHIDKKIDDLDINKIIIEQYPIFDDNEYTIEIVEKNKTPILMLHTKLYPSKLVKIIAGIIQKKEKALKKLIKYLDS